MKLNVFYSWQSDLPKDSTSSAIRTCIKKAIPEIESKTEDLFVNLTEATSNDPGSPDIAEKILHKIDICDVFIADITTINNTETPKRKTPNPNVLIELGYAISRVGWGRIILLFNEEYGSIDANEVPFDIDRKRISKFRVKDKQDKSGLGQLKAILSEGIQTIYTENPIKPKVSSSEFIKRERDVSNLTKVFSQINLPILDQHFAYAPQRMVSDCIVFLEGFESVFFSSTFHLYDKEALRLVKAFYESWRKSFLYFDLYSETGSPGLYKLGHPGRRFANEELKLVRELTDASLRCPKDLKSLISYVRENYTEVDIDALSEQAWKEFKGLSFP